MIRYALNKGASFHAVNLDGGEELDGINDYISTKEGGDAITYNLFIFPGECNFSGVKYPLDLINRVHNMDTDKRYMSKACVNIHNLSNDSLLPLPPPNNTHNSIVSGR